MLSQKAATSRILTGAIGALVGCLLGALACFAWGVLHIQAKANILQCAVGGACLGLTLGLAGGPSAVRFLWRVIGDL
jgi:hypothetical protein